LDGNFNKDLSLSLHLEQTDRRGEEPVMKEHVMRTRVRNLSSAIVIACLALMQPVYGAVLEGQTISVTNFHGTAPDMTLVIGPASAVVGAGIEFDNFGWTGFVDIDVSDTSIVITLNTNQPFGYFETLRFMDPGGLLPDFTGATVNAATNWAGFNQSRVVVSANAIDVNMTALHGLQGQRIALDVTAVAGPSVPTAVNDTFATSLNTMLAVPSPGVLANDNSNGGGAMSAVLDSNTTNGSLTLNANGSFAYTPDVGFSGSDSFMYHAVSTVGSGNVVTVTITVSAATVPLPPAGLYVSSIVGNLVTLRWNIPPGGLAPTNFVLEGGVSPGQILASISTGSASPIFTFTAPTGSFYVRLHAENGALRSEASNEIRIHVNVPVPPSAPADLLALVNGSSVALTWKNTFGGGPPSGVMLDVAGPVGGSLPLGLVDHASFSGVPAGTYTLSLRATNGGGSSTASNAVTLTFPGPCTGAPLSPTNFLAYKRGSTIFVLWDPPAAGPAPTGYILNVSGSVAAALPTTARALSSAAPPGSYSLSVSATNACGASAATAALTVSIP
jgi:hypothetical protein